MKHFKLLILILIVVEIVQASFISGGLKKRPEIKLKCPKMRSIRNFDLERLLGKWYVIEYYASSEEALAYRCMRADFTLSQDHGTGVTMNFTYSFTDDPLNEQLIGNITWTIPDMQHPAHWTHSEDSYEGVYNTYVLDSDYDEWTLMLHCAEKSKSPRYLSSLVMSRTPTLGVNVISYLRDKLPRYDIDLRYMFDMTQVDCDMPLAGVDVPASILETAAVEQDGAPPKMRAHQRRRKTHPLKHHRQHL